MFCLAACSQIASAKNQRTPDDQFISFSDIHFDPFAGCKPALTSCELLNKLRIVNYQQWDDILEQYSPKTIAGTSQDTNYALLKVTLRELQQINNANQLKFGIIPGDFLAHDFRLKYVLYSKDWSSTDFHNFEKKTLQFLGYKIQRILPNIDLYPAVGNNDSYTGDYNVVPNGTFLHDTATTWSAFIPNYANRMSFLQNFPEAGYYSVTLPNNKFQRLIVLNTVLFSVKAKGSNISTAADQELVWLQQQLVSAANLKQHVILVSHIPIGIDMYATWQSHFSNMVEFWQQHYSQLFQSEIKDFSNQITAIFSAHIHIDSFRFVSLRKIANVPIFFTPSISPIFGNAPAFKVFSYDPVTFRVTSFVTYSLDPDGKWKKN